MLISCVWQSSYRLVFFIVEKSKKKKKNHLYHSINSLFFHDHLSIIKEENYIFRSFNGSLLQNLCIYRIDKINKVILQ